MPFSWWGLQNWTQDTAAPQPSRVVFENLIFMLEYPGVLFNGLCAGLKNARHLNSSPKFFLIVHCYFCILNWSISVGFLSMVLSPWWLKCAAAHSSVEEKRIILGIIGSDKIMNLWTSKKNIWSHILPQLDYKILLDCINWDLAYGLQSTLYLVTLSRWNYCGPTWLEI